MTVSRSLKGKIREKILESSTSSSTPFCKTNTCATEPSFITSGPIIAYRFAGLCILGIPFERLHTLLIHNHETRFIGANFRVGRLYLGL